MVARRCDISILWLLFLVAVIGVDGASNQDREMFRFIAGISTDNDEWCQTARGRYQFAVFYLLIWFFGIVSLPQFH